MTPMITGRTKIIAHLGLPTESFKAPMIYNPWFAEEGIDCVVVPMGCDAVNFPEFMRYVARLTNFAGALITMPHKVSAVDLLDETSVSVDVCGSCNAIRRGADGKLIGDMFDGEGFVRGALRKDQQISGCKALVVGSGGVGSAIAAALAAKNVSKLALYDIKSKAAEDLAMRLSGHFTGLEIVTGSNDPSGFDIVVNATPLGMSPNDEMPVDPEKIDQAAFVGEVVMTAHETAFLAAARKRGCRTQVGTDMLFEQIPAYLEFFGFPTTTPENLRKLAEFPN